MDKFKNFEEFEHSDDNFTDLDPDQTPTLNFDDFEQYSKKSIFENDSVDDPGLSYVNEETSIFQKVVYAIIVIILLLLIF